MSVPSVYNATVLSDAAAHGLQKIIETLSGVPFPEFPAYRQE
jgi:hypothetical protein